MLRAKIEPAHSKGLFEYLRSLIYWFMPIIALRLTVVAGDLPGLMIFTPHLLRDYA